MTSSNGNIFRVTGPLCAGNSPVTGEFPVQRPVTRSFDIFFICAWINGWVNNCKAGDLRRHRAHYDVTVMGKQYLESLLLPIKLQQGIQWITNHLIPSCPSFLSYFPNDVMAWKRLPHYWPFIMVSCQKGSTRHAYAWQIGPFWQDTLVIRVIDWGRPLTNGP